MSGWKRLIPNIYARGQSTSTDAANSRQLKILHLFRHLLREATYLPDPVSRSYFLQYISTRFRKAQSWPSPSFQPVIRKQMPCYRESHALKAAYSGLIYLRRANAGHRRQMTKILEITYGRTGPRRYELLDAVKATPPTPESSSLPEAEAQWDIHHNIPTALSTLLRSQVNRPSSTLRSRPNVKYLEPQIPEKNAWGRPMPLKRVRNMEKRWLAETLERIQPPLPASDWEDLRAKAEGREHVVVPRRRGPRGKEEGNEQGQKTYMTESGVSRPHRLTRRFMRKLWSKILGMSPVLERKEGRQGLRARWVDERQERHVNMKTTSKGMAKMFEGVDENGKIVRPEFNM